MNDNSSAKTPEFRKVMRGYDPAEVSAYIDSLKKELGEARRMGQELDERLSSVMTRYDEVQKKSDELDAALAEIDRERDTVMSDAHRRSAAMLDDTRKRCAEAEREMREGISRQRDAFVSMHEMILAFRADLFERYNAQIDSIDSIASLADAYDEAMMFCMQKNGVSYVSRENAPSEGISADKISADANPANKIPDEQIPSEDSPAEKLSNDEEFSPEDKAPIEKTPADQAPSDETPEKKVLTDEASAMEKLVEIPDLEIPDHVPAAPAVEGFDYFTEDFSAKDYSAKNYSKEDDRAGNFSTEDAYAESYSDGDAGDSSTDYSDEGYSDIPAEDDFAPDPEVGFTAQDYSFDEDNHPHLSAADRILADETPCVTRDDLPEDFDIYHASGDQLLDLIYGKGSATPAEDSRQGNDPLRGVDYSFGDD